MSQSYPKDGKDLEELEKDPAWERKYLKKKKFLLEAMFNI